MEAEYDSIDFHISAVAGYIIVTLDLVEFLRIGDALGEEICCTQFDITVRKLFFPLGSLNCSIEKVDAGKHTEYIRVVQAIL